MDQGCVNRYIKLKISLIVQGVVLRFWGTCRLAGILFCDSGELVFNRATS